MMTVFSPSISLLSVTELQSYTIEVIRFDLECYHSWRLRHLFTESAYFSVYTGNSNA